MYVELATQSLDILSLYQWVRRQIITQHYLYVSERNLFKTPRYCRFNYSSSNYACESQWLSASVGINENHIINCSNVSILRAAIIAHRNP